MYKYYLLDEWADAGRYFQNYELIAFEKFNERKEITNETVYANACGYVLLRNPLTEKDILNCNLANAGIVNRNTKLKNLPENLIENIKTDINNFYKKVGNNHKMDKETFIRFYGEFSLDDLYRMIPVIANKYALVADKDKTMIEKILDTNSTLSV